MKKIKKISMALIVFVLMFEACYALTGDSVTIYKTSMSAVTSLAVSSPADQYEMYVSAYGDDGLNLKITPYSRNGVNESYEKYTLAGTITVDHGKSSSKVFKCTDEFVRIKLSGWGQGVGR